MSARIFPSMSKRNLLVHSLKDIVACSPTYPSIWSQIDDWQTQAIIAKQLGSGGGGSALGLLQNYQKGTGYFFLAPDQILPRLPNSLSRYQMAPP